MLTTSFPRFKGDPAGIFIYNLCLQLIEKGIDIEVIAPHDHGCEFLENWDGIRIHRFPYFYPFKYQRLCYGAGILQNVRQSVPAMVQLPFFVIAEILYSLRTIKRCKTDLIHAHWSMPQGLTGVLCRYIYGVPCVTTIHGSDIYGLRLPLINALNAKVIQCSNACTANSKLTGRASREISSRGDIEIIPMGIDPSFFKRSREVGHLRKRFGVGGKSILFVGRLIDLKGIDYLIKAVPKVLERYPKTKLLLVGSGPQKDRLINLSRSLGITNTVLFIGELGQEELPKFYSLATVFVLPSVVNEKGETEGLGVVLLEAMACGIPVIGSNVGGIPDIISDGETGLLATQKDPDDLAQKIIRLLSDERLRTVLIENGLSLVRNNFSWEVIADKFITIYHDIFNQDKN
ncbi:MAG: glycosyltransferase [Deltaproteobacteria bacterium]|nr:glycosyltransferase [Deltaproteobacteria bacterium]